MMFLDLVLVAMLLVPNGQRQYERAVDGLNQAGCTVYDNIYVSCPTNPPNAIPVPNGFVETRYGKTSK
jgi:hypothetical protein